MSFIFLFPKQIHLFQYLPIHIKRPVRSGLIAPFHQGKAASCQLEAGDAAGMYTAAAVKVQFVRRIESGPVGMPGD